MENLLAPTQGAVPDRSCQRLELGVSVSGSFGDSPLLSLYMPKRPPDVTEPVSIVVREGVVLKTTIDPLTKKHQVQVLLSRDSRSEN